MAAPPMDMSTTIMPRVSIIPIPSVAGSEKIASMAKEHQATVAETPKAGLGAAGAPVMVSIPVFNETVGMHYPAQHPNLRQQHALQHPVYNLPLTRTGRQNITRSPQSRLRSGSGSAQAGFLEERLDEAVDTLMAVLRKEDDSGASTDLDERYDPLERYQLLEETLKRLEGKDMPLTEKETIRTRLQAMSSELFRKHGKKLDGARPAMAMIDDVIEELGIAGLSGDALRGRLGTPGKSFEPMELATKLLDEVGDDRFMKALSAVSNGMLSELRTRMDGPKLWMSLKDAEAIKLIRSCVAAAQGLRAQLSTLKVRSRMSGAAMSIQLMLIAQSGKVKAGSLISKMINTDQIVPHTLARTFIAVRETIAALPMPMWPGDKSDRQEILAEIHAQAVSAFANLPAKPTEAQRLEKSLRKRFKSRRGS